MSFGCCSAPTTKSSCSRADVLGAEADARDDAGFDAWDDRKWRGVPPESVGSFNLIGIEAELAVA